MPDMTITCVDCGSDFSFSERDQAFFAERGMSTPKRCRECRAARKAQGGGAGAPRGGDRVRHPIVCQQCGKEDRQGCVFRTGDGDFALETSRTLNTEFIH